jgi:hypothetical protein
MDLFIRQLRDCNNERLALRRRNFDLEKELSMMRKIAEAPNEVRMSG